MSDNTTGEVIYIKEQTNSITVVAIGGATGGTEAVCELLQHLPAETGMAFVYIQHATGTTLSTGKFQNLSNLKIIEAKPGMVVLPDHFYIIPANLNVTFVDGVLNLSTLPAEITSFTPIDDFFISLATNQNKASIGIILSGSSVDGTIGIKAIKQAGGITYAQDNSASHLSMPISATVDGVVDAVLSPKEIAAELVRLSKSKDLLNPVLPNDFDVRTDDDEVGDKESVAIEIEDIRAILRHVKSVVGVDFTHYKPNTIRRRLIRRMLLLKFERLEEYFEYIKKNRNETDLLYQDLLINVTQFFRDQEAVAVLKTQVLPELVKTKSLNDPIHIWVPACSTGQEAYSMAMLLLEVLGDNPVKTGIQIFATDLSDSAIAKARVGIYNASEVQGVSETRLSNFFTKLDGQFRIIKQIRDVCIFAPHNIFKDPPFSRVDLISCCNLLIYLDNVLQKKILSNFHYALNKNGYLVLGRSETIGSSTNLFYPLDKKAKVFIRKNEIKAKAFFDLNILAEKERDEPKVAIKIANKNSPKESLDKLVDNILIAQYVPAAVVINYDLDILQFRGSTSLYLEPAPGRASLNLLKMTKPGIELELRNAVNKVIKTGEVTKVAGLNITDKGSVHNVAFEITPLISHEQERLLLIVFEEVKATTPSDVKINFSKDRRVRQLEAELTALREDMRSMIEEQEAANEELQSANEEIVSSNEELQSINEELETSKEELESTNEELLTINQELQTINDQLAESNEYTQQVINTIRESVLVLDSNLFVRSANKAFYRTFKLREADTESRFVYEIGKGEWNIPKLKELFDELLPRKDQIFGFQLKQKFDGVGEKVLLLNAKKVVQKSHHQKFILIAIEDITEHKHAEKLLEEREAWLRNMANNVPAMLWVAGADKSFTFVNKTWLQFTGRTLQKETGIGWTEGVCPNDIDFVLSTYHESFLVRKPFELQYRMRRYDGEFRWILNKAVPGFDAEGEFSGFTGSCTEIHDTKMMHEELERRVNERTGELQEANVNLERSNSELAQFAYVASHDLQEPLRKIITFSGRMRERFFNVLPMPGQELIEKISFSAERMRNLIDDLLNFSRISRFEKRFVLTDLNKIVKNVLSDFDLLIQEKNAVLDVQNLPVIKAVPLQMNQLFHNLVGNALKFTTPDRTPHIAITCKKLLPEEAGGYIGLDVTLEYHEITVTDNGIGFSQEFAEQVFVIFQRLNDKDEYPGTGIGLALCRKIARNHGGEIYAKSEEGKGSCFYILLPIEPPSHLGSV